MRPGKKGCRKTGSMILFHYETYTVSIRDPLTECAIVTFAETVKQRNRSFLWPHGAQAGFGNEKGNVDEKPRTARCCKYREICPVGGSRSLGKSEKAGSDFV